MKRVLRLLLIVGLASVIGPCTWVFAATSVRQSCVLAWDAPTLNSDASPLTDLQDYRVYVSQTTGVLGTLKATVTQPTVQVACTTLVLSSGLSYVVVKARDTTGNESVVSGELALSVTTQPPRVQHHRRR